MWPTCMRGKPRTCSPRPLLGARGTQVRHLHHVTHHETRTPKTTHAAKKKKKEKRRQQQQQELEELRAWKELEDKIRKAQAERRERAKKEGRGVGGHRASPAAKGSACVSAAGAGASARVTIRVAVLTNILSATAPLGR